MTGATFIAANGGYSIKLGPGERLMATAKCKTLLLCLSMCCFWLFVIIPLG